MHVNEVLVYLLPAVVFTLIHLLGVILVAALGRGPGRVVGALGCFIGLLGNGTMLLVVVLLMADVIDFSRTLGDVLLLVKILLDALALTLLVVGVILTRAVKPAVPARH